MTRIAARSPVLLGLTGGIGCGKSAAGAALESLNVAVMDADIEAHRLMRRGMPVYDEVVQAFGPAIVGTSGEIDRGRLAEIVFRDRARLELLNTLVHPAVRECWRQWTAARFEEGRDAAVIIPLLYEVGETAGWDAVICVAASEALVRARLRERGMSEQQMTERIGAQMPLDEKCRRADYVIWNNGSLKELKESISAVYREIISKRERSL